MRNQKTIFRLSRLLALAVVSCALAALLTGCSKEEFIVGYKKFMFGDWLPGSSSSASSAASSSEESSEPEHVYDAPNPECDAKINALMSELYSLEASAQADVSSVVQAAKDEYHAQSDHSTSKKYLSFCLIPRIFMRFRANMIAWFLLLSARCAASCGSTTSPRLRPIRPGATISLPKAA